MWLKLIRIRHNGERIVDQGDNYKDDINEVKTVLDRFVPGVYKSYACYDKHGNMIASKGLF